MFRSILSRLPVWLLCGAVALALATGAARADKGGKGKKPKLSKVQGQITAVDTTAMTVTIQPKKGSAVTLTVTSTTKIEVNDVQPATLADVQNALNGLAAGEILKGKATFDSSNNQAATLDAEVENDDGAGHH